MGRSWGVPATSAPAAVKSKPISLRYFQSLFHQEAASATIGTNASEAATHFTQFFMLSLRRAGIAGN